MRKKNCPPTKFKFLSLYVLVFVVSVFLGYKFSSLKLHVNTKTDGSFDPSKKIAYFHGQKFNVPNEISENWASSAVLGSDSKKSEQKRIEINLTKQELYAYEGKDRVYKFKVSTGKWGATPTGEFRIWLKTRYTLMTGGNSRIGTYYYLPNVPFTMFFYNGSVSQSQGFSIHGTYWHDNFGHPMSHGCINMKTEEAEKLFYWANPPLKAGQTRVTSSNEGTRVIIYGETPQS